ncbi:MAG: serine/threonine protein kinase [Myxococcota bacterium]|nr:serine/threonine protein kinase [Myxococcota bacterium]
MLDGRYRIDTVIGTGGMGRVYKGEHTGIGRAVAIKVLHTDLSRNREAAQRFQREALASGRLDHPNIVGVSDFGVLDDGSCYLVMEALEGEPLGKRLERDGRVEWPEALEILRGVLSGLKHAHEKGVVHRDIKPDNIFLAQKDGEIIVKILDFGIAKLRAGSGDDPASTRAGLTVGTPAYLSPEQAVGGEITPASDLYSASIVLFEMIAGRAPFVEREPLAMLGAHVSRPPPKLADVAPDLKLPANLEEVLGRGLAKVSAERYTNAIEYIGALDAVISGVPLASNVDMGRASTLSLEANQDSSMMMEILPGTPAATPIHGVYRLPDGRIATPMPGSISAPIFIPASTVEGVAVDRQKRAVSLHDLPPLPKRWYIIGAAIVGVLIVIAIIAALASGGEKAPKKQAPKKASSAPPIVMPVPAKTVDKEMVLKALLHDLQASKTCAERKAAIPKLVELGDPRAFEPLRKARYRMSGGLLGIGSNNVNHCLKADAEAAMKKLAPPKN